MAALDPAKSPLAPAQPPTSINSILAQQPQRVAELQGDVAEADKKVADINTKEGAMKMPELQAVPPPTPQPTDPSKIWGSAAMLLAGLGGMMTRRPIVTAMNAASKVFEAYRSNDQEAARTAYDSWKVANENAMKIADFQQKQYKEALDGYEKDKTGALASLKAKMAAFQDTTGIQQLELHGIQGAQQHIIELERLQNDIAKAKPGLEKGNDQHMLAMEMRSALAELKQATASGDQAKIQAANDKVKRAHQDAVEMNAAYGKGGTAGNPRSLPAAFAQKYLQEHPDATAEDLENAASEYREKQSASGTLGTRSTQIDLAATEAGNFAEQALAASKEVPRTNWRAANSAIQAGQTQASDPKLQKLLVATDALVNARARAISPSGQPHLSDQIEGRRLLSTAQSAETYEAAVQQMLAEVQGVKDATKTVKGEMHGDGSGRQAPNAGKATPKVTTQAEYDALPAGTVYTEEDGKKYKKP